MSNPVTGALYRDFAALGDARNLAEKILFDFARGALRRADQLVSEAESIEGPARWVRHDQAYMETRTADAYLLAITTYRQTGDMPQ